VRTRDRQRLCARLGWATFVAAVVSALLATWNWDQQWLATAAVLLFAACVLAVAAADL
jgi:hypothetical protein